MAGRLGRAALRPPPGYSTWAIRAAAFWLLLFAISAVVTNMTNTAVVRALSKLALAGAPTVARNFDDLCSQDVDFVLYEHMNRWLPARRSAFCTSKTFLDGPAKGLAAELAHAGRLEATVSIVALGAVRLEVYCVNGTQDGAVNPDVVFRAEAGIVYQQLCSRDDAGVLARSSILTRNH
jgi:NAD(P)-dependent dehydrogenase (short-subunit alcohol dehydrogenase family)